MKISNETKVGSITVVTVTLLVLGFNFLKGKTFFSNDTTLYCVYGNVQGLSTSNPVNINGLQVGSVYKISTDKDMRKITVELIITKQINIPTNSIALIKPNPLGTTSIEIKLGNANTYFKTKDTVATEPNKGIFDDVLKRLDPVVSDVRRTLGTLDNMLGNINSAIDPRAKDNIGKTLENLNKITAAMLISTASLNELLNTQTGALAKTLNNASSVTGNLAANNDKVTAMMTNLTKTTEHLSQLDLQKTLSSLDSTINGLKALVGKVNTSDGTLGKLLNDPRLYNNLASTSNKINLLLDDIRVNPKRYVSISVFGKKQNNNPLLIPLPDTVSSPYIIKKAP